MNLATRSAVEERMDTDCIDYDDYCHCLRDLARVNAVTLTHRPMLGWLSRETAKLTSFSLIDVACGHGDALRRIRRWASRRGLAVQLHGIDRNPWATRTARAATDASASISYRTADVVAMEPVKKYDFVVSSQFAHHLSDGQVVMFIRWMEASARLGWFIGDLHRHWLPYYGFGPLAWLARWHRFVLSDGRISIARAFVPSDWRRLTLSAGIAESDVAITWHMPFRLCVTRRCPEL